MRDGGGGPALLASAAVVYPTPPPAGYYGQAAPTPVRVGLGRSNAVVTFCVLVFLCLVVGAAAKGALTSTGSARVLGAGIALVFTVPLVMLLRALPRFLGRRYVVLDVAGLHIQHGKEEVVVPWSEVYAVGLGYEQAAEERKSVPTSMDDLKGIVKDYTVDKVSEALQVSGKRRIALEIMPVRPDTAKRYPKLQPYWKHQPPPWAGLPPEQWRFPLPPVVSIAEEIERGIRTFQPQRFLGWYPRPWSG
jgi:hypothetical protein